jgi:hypothetical protein
MLPPKRRPSKSLADLVTTQIELPLYYGFRRPLDLITIKIIFGRHFEAF